MTAGTGSREVARIRQLNDAFRRTGTGGRMVMTAGIAALPDGLVTRIVAQVMAFDSFTEDNDPYSEHDFGSLEVEGLKVFWKIDTYDGCLEHGSPDPSDPTVTARVLTIMRADEY